MYLQEGQTAVALLELAVNNGIHADYAGRLLALLAPDVVGAVREPPLQEPPQPDDLTARTGRELDLV